MNESPGAITGARRSPIPLQPGTPSDQLSSSIPCQWMEVDSGRRFLTVMSVGCPRVSTRSGPGTDTVSPGCDAACTIAKPRRRGARPRAGVSRVSSVIRRGFLRTSTGSPGRGSTRMPSTSPAMCRSGSAEWAAWESGGRRLASPVAWNIRWQWKSQLPGRSGRQAILHRGARQHQVGHDEEPGIVRRMRCPRQSRRVLSSRK